MLNWCSVSLRFTRRLAIALGLLLCAAAAGCGPAPQGTPANNPAPQTLPEIKAEVLTVEPSVWPAIVRTQGSLVADEVSVVGAKVAGRVGQVHVDLGDVVRTGEPLATLDQAEFRLHVEQAQAQYAQACAAVGLAPGDPVESLDRENAPPVRQEKALWNEAKANLERALQLRAQNVITQAEVEQIAAAERVADARYVSALNGVNEKIALIGVRAAELALARQRLHDAAVRAPFDGLIEQRYIAPGAYVQVGTAIATMVRGNPLRFRGTIPERHAQRLAVGQEVRLRIESAGGPRLAKITRISPVLDEFSRALLFEAIIDNRDGGLRTGLFVEADIVLDPQVRAIVVPRSCVVEFAGSEKVWKVVDGVAQEQVVQTGQRRTDLIEIVDGLAAGDVILRVGDEGRVAQIDPVFVRSVSQPQISSGEAARIEGQERSRPESASTLQSE